MTYLRKHYAVPAEHGSWVWWIGPFLIGLAAAGRVSLDVLWLLAAVAAGFLLRQPASLLVKVLAGRRPKADLGPAAFWLVVYSLAGLTFVSGIVLSGHGRVLVLALPGLVVFAWHMWLMYRREERGQIGVEIVGAGVLALAAPASYTVAGGSSTLLAGLLWILCWLQSAASILLVYSRLGERKLQALPPLSARVRGARRVYLYHIFNLLAAGALALVGWLPWLWTAAFGLMLADLLAGTLRPMAGVKPTRIGVRQLIASASFVALAAAGHLM